MKAILISTWMVCVLLHSSLKGQEGTKGVQFTDSTLRWESLLQQGTQENKLIFLDCYTSWCGPCKAMAKDVFTQEEVGQYMNSQFINAQRDMEKGEGKVLHDHYKKYIIGYPTFLLINGRGEVIYQSTGYQEPRELISGLKEGLKGHSWATLAVQYDQGKRDWPFLNLYMKDLQRNYQVRRVTDLLASNKSRLSVDSLLQDTAAAQFFLNYWDDATMPVFRQFIRQDVRIADKAKVSNSALELLEDQIYKSTVDNLTALLKEHPETYSSAMADSLIEDLFISHAKSRSDLITQLRINQAQYSKDYNTYTSLLQSVRNLGLLRYNEYFLANSIENMTKNSTSPDQLEVLLTFTDWLSTRPFASKDLKKLHTLIVSKINP